MKDKAIDNSWMQLKHKNKTGISVNQFHSTSRSAFLIKKKK